MNSKDVELELLKKSDKEKAKFSQGFFKTGKGEYGEGDIHLGIKVPIVREIAKEFYGLNLEELQKLLESPIHDCRQIALFILIKKYETLKKQKSQNKNELQEIKKSKKEIFDFYLKNTENINNWDLVDLSAPNIIGDYLLDKKSERKVLYKLAKSNKKGRNGFCWLWEKRIAILATFAFIKNNEFEDTLKLAEQYLTEKHDLMHKASGWALREVGKKDEKVLIQFLDKHVKEMPRTMLRYSIERLNEKKRKYYLEK